MSKTEELDLAIADWRAAARWERLFNPSCPSSAVQCDNAARELEILRDTGKEVHLNRRTA